MYVTLFLILELQDAMLVFMPMFFGITAFMLAARALLEEKFTWDLLWWALL